MVSRRSPASQTAPGRLETIRELLNSWLIPNNVRKPTDRVDEYAQAHRISDRERRVLRRLRDDLRLSIEQRSGADERLDAWVRRLRIVPTLRHESIAYRHGGGAVGELFTIVLDAIAAGDWRRLKACPDCRWVFFDHTRNASKRWCKMTAGGPDGRSCGSISKVRRYRERHALSRATGHQIGERSTRSGRRPRVPSIDRV